jgi:hypothetical protein
MNIPRCSPAQVLLKQLSYKTFSFSNKLQPSLLDFCPGYIYMYSDDSFMSLAFLFSFSILFFLLYSKMTYIKKLYSFYIFILLYLYYITYFFYIYVYKPAMILVTIKALFLLKYIYIICLCFIFLYIKMYTMLFFLYII